MSTDYHALRAAATVAGIDPGDLVSFLDSLKAEAWDEGFDSGHYVNEQESRDCGCRVNPYEPVND